MVEFFSSYKALPKKKRDFYSLRLCGKSNKDVIELTFEAV